MCQKKFLEKIETHVICYFQYNLMGSFNSTQNISINKMAHVFGECQ